MTARCGPLRVNCPALGCGGENDVRAEVCRHCLTPIEAYCRLALHPLTLFNRGLTAARAGEMALARECFAAVVFWQPEDLAARNAHALACLEARDDAAARQGWREVLERSPTDAFATRGLAALSRGGARRGRRWR